MKTKKIIPILQIKRGFKTRLSRKRQGQGKRHPQHSAPLYRMDSDDRGGDGVDVDVSHTVANGPGEYGGWGWFSTSTDVLEADRQTSDPNFISESLRGGVNASVESSTFSPGSDSRGIIVYSPERAAGEVIDGLNEKGGMHSVVVDSADDLSVCSCGALSVHSDDGLYWNWCCGSRVLAPEEFTVESEYTDAAKIAYSNEIYHPPRENFPFRPTRTF